MERNLAKRALQAGGVVKPMIIPSSETRGSGLCNPSVFIDDNGEILVIIRNVNYDFFHLEHGKRFANWATSWLIYLHREDDVRLHTVNFLAKLNEDLDIEWHHKIDTSELDVEPIWSFVGLEDARLFRWDGKLYGSGVRRDTTDYGQGRMELSELQVTPGAVREVKRNRIELPFDPDSYCEKNWMPILDKPFHYIKWANPTQVVKVSDDKNSCEVVYQSEKTVPDEYGFRGGSQVIRIPEGYLAIIHETNFGLNEHGTKNAAYPHRFVIWDEDFEIIRTSEMFHFMDSEIEFCCGLADHGDNFLITYGNQDNTAYIMSIPKQTVYEFIG